LKHILKTTYEQKGIKQLMIIKGYHIHGMKGARRSLKRQKKIFVELGLPGAEKFFNGTINIDTQPVEYTIGSFDYLFKNVEHKSFPRKRQEDFGFIIIEELIHNNISYKKWGYIYIPHKSPHFKNLHMFEIIGPPLKNFKEYDTFKLMINAGRLVKL